jgi:nitrate/nitrite transport system ATP-binding protein
MATDAAQAATGAPVAAEFLTLSGLTKSYPGRAVLAPVDLAVPAGQFATLLGPSGCGKSTLLGMIAGLVEPTAGAMTLDGAPITRPGADRGVVFQQHVLLPWLTAKQNVRFALDCALPGLPAAERERRAVQALQRVHLGDAMDRKPGQLSGGMQQRVGIARAFALAPKVLLLDEPFGALDALTRVSLQRQLLELWEADRRTVIMVTHDVEEAVLLSDRILVMSHGPAARIVDEVAVPFPRPREQAVLRTDPEFHALVARLLAQLTAPT